MNVEIVQMPGCNVYMSEVGGALNYRPGAILTYCVAIVYV